MHASVTADKAYGRDTSGHIIGIYTAPEGQTVDDPEFKKKILDNLAQVDKDHPDELLRSIGYFKSPDVLKNMSDEDLRDIFAFIKARPPVKHRVSNTDPPTLCPLCNQTHGLGELNAKK